MLKRLEWKATGISATSGMGHVPVGEVVEVEDGTAAMLVASGLATITEKAVTWPRDMKPEAQPVIPKKHKDEKKDKEP